MSRIFFEKIQEIKNLKKIKRSRNSRKKKKKFKKIEKMPKERRRRIDLKIRKYINSNFKKRKKIQLERELDFFLFKKCF